MTVKVLKSKKMWLFTITKKLKYTNNIILSYIVIFIYKRKLQISLNKIQQKPSLFPQSGVGNMDQISNYAIVFYHKPYFGPTH